MLCVQEICPTWPIALAGWWDNVQTATTVNISRTLAVSCVTCAPCWQLWRPMRQLRFEFFSKLSKHALPLSAYTHSVRVACPSYGLCLALVKSIAKKTQQLRYTPPNSLSLGSAMKHAWFLHNTHADHIVTKALSIKLAFFSNPLITQGGIQVGFGQHQLSLPLSSIRSSLLTRTDADRRTSVFRGRRHCSSSASHTISPSRFLDPKGRPVSSTCLFVCPATARFGAAGCVCAAR